MSVKKLAITAASVGVAAWALTEPNAAQADRSGAVAAGIAGGIIGGAIIGSAMAPRPYYEQAPVYAVPPPPGPRCYWARGEPVWDEWQRAWVRPRMRVCD